MKVEEKFNLKTAKLLETQQPFIGTARGLALGIKVQFALPCDGGVADLRSLAIHMTPEEALDFAADLIVKARIAQRY